MKKCYGYLDKELHEINLIFRYIGILYYSLCGQGKLPRGLHC